MRNKKYHYLKITLLTILAIILFIVSLESLPGMIFPMWIIVYLLRNKLIKIVDKIPLPVAFIGLGTIFGLLTEFFAVIGSINIPSGERVLMSQNLVTDMLLAPAYYTFFIIVIYFLVKRYDFSKKSIFIISGIYGIFTENGGVIFLGIFVNPILGIAMAFLVMCVYAIFPLLTYMITEHRFDKKRIKATWKIYLLLPIIFFFVWALFGNIVLPAFKLVFGS